MASNPSQYIATYLEEASHILVKMAESLSDMVEIIAQKAIETLRNGDKILLCGNGGSAADCQHVACELVGKFRRMRPALPAIALTTDTSTLTAVANDLGFQETFCRQVEALGRPGDLLIAISTSGNSPNVLKAVETARSKGLITVGLTGRDGGTLASMVDLSLAIPSSETPHIQEAHITVLHLICALVEEALAR